jgi:hypothetical protein
VPVPLSWLPVKRFLLLLPLGLLLVSCQAGAVGAGTSPTPAAVPSGSAHSLSLHGVDGVDLRVPAELYLASGATERLTTSAAPAVLAKLRATVQGSVLRLSLANGASISTNQPIVYHLTLPRVSSIAVEGAGLLQAASPAGGHVRLQLDGAARADIQNLRASDLTAQLTGASSVSLTGSTSTEEVQMSGAGDYRADTLDAEQVNISLSGAGACRVRADRSLDVTINGLGKVTYAGHPASVQRHVSGLGSITAE